MTILDSFNKDFKDFIQALCKNKIKFVIIGGYAVNYYGYVRATGDLDILCLSESIKDLRMVIQDFFGQDMGPVELEYGQLLRIGVPPYRIELLSQIDGITSKEVYKNSEVVDSVNEWEVRVIAKEDLIRNKRASGRYKDLADIEGLGEEVNGAENAPEP